MPPMSSGTLDRIRILSIHARRMIECVVTARRSFETALGLRGFQVLGADKSVAAIVVDIFCHQNITFVDLYE